MMNIFAVFGDTAFTLMAFVVALSVIVTVHEYGHYIVGRWSGIHAEVFSLGFGPVLWQRVDRRGTRWQIAALPLGGYVRFLGDANAASGKDGAVMKALPPDELRRTMHGAPLWARAATVAAGPLFNFMFSVIVLVFLYVFSGVPSDRPVIDSMKPQLAGLYDLQKGDVILAINGVQTPDYKLFFETASTLPAADGAEYEIDRGGNVLKIAGPYPFLPIIDEVQPKTAAAAAGLQRGDVILEMDGRHVQSFDQMRSIVDQSEGRSLAVTLRRGGDIMQRTVTPTRRDLPLPDGGFETRWLMGVSGGMFFTPERRPVGVGEAVAISGGEIKRIVQTNLSGMWHVIKGAISTCNLQGVLTIASVSGAMAQQGPDVFVHFIAVLSVAVGMMNLFPIPVLDGGHLVFFAWEAVTGRPPAERLFQALMGVGLVLIVGLMLFALRNDLFCV